METQEDKIIRKKLEDFYGTNKIAYCEINGDRVSFGVFQGYSHGVGDTWIDDRNMSIDAINKL